MLFVLYICLRNTVYRGVLMMDDKNLCSILQLCRLITAVFVWF